MVRTNTGKNWDKTKKVMDNLRTDAEMTWCPRCPDYLILESAKIAISNLIAKGYKHEDFAMSVGIGCHGKIFDYLNISGLYGLHGRALPTALGIHLGNPNLKVLAFAGDGDTYSEGMSHFIQQGRYNADITLIVFDNQSFSLTTGQSTPTSQQGFINKAYPLGEFNKPLNPLQLSLASHASFIARANAHDHNHTAQLIEKAILHKGFSYVEIIQDCIVFNLDINNKDPLMYTVPDNTDKKKAEKLVTEWDYNSKKGKIPLGVLYKEERPTLADNWPQLKRLTDEKKSWKQTGK